TTFGDNITIGHNAMVPGLTIHDRVLVGIHATLLDKVIVHSDVMIAAGSLVPPGKELESGYLYMGSPVKQARKLSEHEIKSIQAHADNYVKYARAYQQKDTYDKNPFF
ncbi:MAG: gamma carbonic anhydrase family protein, partial [Balneolaceae bacterium]